MSCSRRVLLLLGCLAEDGKSGAGLLEPAAGCNSR